MNNIYMGNKSTAGIRTHGKVNTDLEILQNTYATAYDAFNNIMLTRNPGQMIAATVQEIRKRFSILKLMARKYCPEHLDEIQIMENYSVMNATGKMSDKVYLHKIKVLCMRNGINPAILANIERHINEAEAKAAVPQRMARAPMQRMPIRAKPLVPVPQRNIPGWQKIMPVRAPPIFRGNPMLHAKPVKMMPFKMPSFKPLRLAPMAPAGNPFIRQRAAPMIRPSQIYMPNPFLKRRKR